MTNGYAVERRLKHHKLRRQARRGEIAVRRIYKFCRFMFVLFIFYSAYRLAATHFWYLPVNIYEKPSVHLEVLGNRIVSTERIITVVSPDSAPIKRIVQEAKERGMLIDASYGRRTRAVIIMDSDHVVLSAILPVSIASRVNGKDAQDIQEEKIEE